MPKTFLGLVISGIYWWSRSSSSLLTVDLVSHWRLWKWDRRYPPIRSCLSNFINKLLSPFVLFSISKRKGNIEYIKIFYSPFRDEVVRLVFFELHLWIHWITLCQTILRILDESPNPTWYMTRPVFVAPKIRWLTVVWFPKILLKYPLALRGKAAMHSSTATLFDLYCSTL
jgi:hypothetical protein